MRKPKSFDCVEMMHEAGRRVADRLRGMTTEQRLDYWRRQTEALRREQAELRAQAETCGIAGTEPDDLGAPTPPPLWPRDMTTNEEAAYLAERMEELRRFEARMRATLPERAPAAKA